MPESDKKIIIELEGSGPNGEAQFRQDDLKREVRETLGDHLSEITKDANNRPTIQVGSKTVVLRTARGNPAEIGDVDSSVRPLDRYTSIAKLGTTEFRNLSDSKLLDIDIRKGKTDNETDPTGEEIINDASRNLGESEIAQSVQRALLQNNTYADEPENKYVNPETAQEENESNVGHAVLQAELGRHSPRKFPDAVSDDVRFEIKNLKNLGLQTLLEASGEYYIPDDTENFGQVVLSKAATMAPGLTRMGIRIPASRFDAATIANTVKEDFRKETRFPKLAGPEHYSYGNVNNPLVPFNAVSSTHAGTAAILLATTICELLRMLADVMGPEEVPISVPKISDMGKSRASKDVPDTTSQDVRRKRLGSYLGKDYTDNNPKTSFVPAGPLFSGGNFFMLTPTQNDYGDAVDVGCQLFFDAPGGGFLAGVAAGAVSALNTLAGGVLGAFGIDTDYKVVAENPSYYSVILRMLVRTTADDIGKLIGAGAGLIGSMAGGGNFMESRGIVGPLDVNPQIGLDADPTNFMNVIQSLRDSKLMRFMDILANIGDIAIFASYNKTTGESFDSYIDSIEDAVAPEGETAKKGVPNPAALIKKHRLSDKAGGGREGQLAWGSRTIRSLYLLPTSIEQAQKNYLDLEGENKLFKAIATGRDFNPSAEKRLTSNDVRAIEMELDACYMPFYFHDLRTNEIIAFHAFMESVTDSLSAEYTESEGFGRIGKVYAYKNTNRTIGCSFRVISTNPQDFSEMWYKINKLVMLLYPQYTEGRKVKVATETGELTFTQPFSQIISNSPLIRLRLGDLFKTNFSELDLVKLFGVGTDAFSLTKGVGTLAIKRRNDAAAEIAARMNNYDFVVGDKFTYFWEETITGRKKGRQKEKEKKTKTPQVKMLVSQVVDGPGKRYIIKYLDGDEMGKETLINFTGFQAGSIQIDSSYLEEEAMNRAGLTPEDLYGDTTSQQQIRDDMQKLFNKDEGSGNPILKSFDSVAGKGVAGFIKSLSFDWTDAMWETDGLNNRAPKWCKIDIEFAPVYDLNPGLDSTGAMIAPLYNVGSLMQALKLRRRKDEEDKYQDYVSKANISEEDEGGGREPGTPSFEAG